MDDAAAWRAALEDERRRKDEMFRKDAHSPIPSSSRASFTGLKYYEPDPALAVEAVLEREASPRTIEVEASGGDLRRYRDVGAARFRIAGAEHALRVWEPFDEEEEPYIFIAFQDATSGDETYGGGRYFDTDPPGPDGRFTLDFNRAYHPYCTYDESWSCVIPPPGNRLPVPVRAGERL